VLQVPEPRHAFVGQNREPTVTNAPPRTTVGSTPNPKRWKAMPIIALAVSIARRGFSVSTISSAVPRAGGSASSAPDFGKRTV